MNKKESEKIKKIIKEQFKLIKPSKEDLEKIKKITDEFERGLKDRLKRKKIIAEIFLGGSLAKGTLIRKKQYDIDIFVRFNKKYGDKKISEILGRALGEKIRGSKIRKIHGSRDYYQLVVDEILIEVIPVLKIKKPEEALNVTDLSYFHVNYILEKIKKDKKLSDEIKIAKSFVHAQNAYGAESYIKGFSGYALELLVCHYGNFLNFIREVAKFRGNKLIIDHEKHYKDINEILNSINASKRSGPIILIDPTFKKRNAAASLDFETFEKFQKACIDFLKNPDKKFFEVKNISDFFKGVKDVKVVKIKTNKQVGDIAGSKSKKFFRFFLFKLKKEFEVKKSDFEYNEEENFAKFYFILNKKKEEIVKGPPVTSLHNLIGFKKAHPDAFIKNEFVYAHIKHDLSFEQWFKKFLKNEKSIIKDMGILSLEILKEHTTNNL